MPCCCPFNLQALLTYRCAACDETGSYLRSVDGPFGRNRGRRRVEVSSEGDEEVGRSRTEMKSDWEGTSCHDQVPGGMDTSSLFLEGGGSWKGLECSLGGRPLRWLKRDWFGWGSWCEGLVKRVLHSLNTLHMDHIGPIGWFKIS